MVGTYTRIDMDELDSRVDSRVDSRLKPLEAENKRLLDENAFLRMMNRTLLIKIDQLLTAIQDDTSVGDATCAALSTALCPEEEETHNHACPDIEKSSETLILSDSIF